MRKKVHYPQLVDWAKRYAKSRNLDIHQFDQYHYRITDGGFVMFDFWTTGRYQIIKTNYKDMSENYIQGRQSEAGRFQVEIKAFGAFLDLIFFPKEIR